MTPIYLMHRCNGATEQRAAYLGSSAPLHEALDDLARLLSFWSGQGGSRTSCTTNNGRFWTTEFGGNRSPGIEEEEDEEH
ncbi:jg4509 [Pararge aegeria aegeria]|uniref:Jg4509 protein n=1 Tax=Pararge aegeria aegeria TaxID=348720 RepID=A0A8S4RFU5_9NEOP|nr:jg4509 [Pararge aegeria aegeria]